MRFVILALLGLVKSENLVLLGLSSPADTTELEVTSTATK